MPILHGQLACHDIQDLERLIRKAIRDAHGPRPDTTQHDDLLADLIATIWETSLRYQPGQGQSSFSQIAYRQARYRTIDWLRGLPGNSRQGRTPAPQVLSLDHLAASVENPDTDPDSRRLADTLAARTGDPQNGLPVDLQRVLAPGDSDRPRLLHQNRRPATRRAA